MGAMPKWDVVVAEGYKDDQGNDKTRWTTVGAGWECKKGVNFNIVTMPGVKLFLFPRRENDDHWKRKPNKGERKPAPSEKASVGEETPF